jgi:beta-phosphoglucomutase-like phosphatase (HAD superfamily)
VNLIVFDIDGTLTDTVAIHQSSFRASLRHIGIEKFNDSFNEYKHHTDSHIAKTIFEMATGKEFDKTTIDVFEEYLHQLIGEKEIIEIFGARQFIRQIEAHPDYGICYATGSFFKPAKLKLERIGIDFELGLLVGSNEIEEREVILTKAIANAADHYSVDKFDRILSFGDGLWDLKAANNLSLEFVGIGDKNVQILKENGMSKHYSDLQKIDINDL